MAIIMAFLRLKKFSEYKKTTNTSDYLVGGRQMNPVVMALSYGCLLYTSVFFAL